MKRILSMAAFIVQICLIHAGNWDWAANLGDAGMERAWELAADASGSHIWAGGEFSGSITVNGVNHPAVGLSDAFVAKYDSLGDLLWFRCLGSPEEDVCLSLAVDPAGNCYFTGFYVGALQFDGSPLPSAGLWDIFAGKYDPEGNLLWLKRFGGTLNDIGYGIGVDAQGNAYITGWFADGFGLGNGLSLQSYGGSDMFVIKLDSLGNPLWAKHGGSSGVEYGYKIDVSPDGTSFATGVAGPECTFDGLSPASNGLYLACYDPTGQIQWLSSAFNAGPINIAVGPGPASLTRGMVAGRVTGTAVFGDTAISSVEGSDDAFCAEFDPTNGNWLNIRQWGGPGSEKGRAVDIRGTSLTAVSYEAGTVFDALPAASFGAWDMAVVGEDAYPPAVWFGGTENDVIGDVKWLSDTRYAVCGWFLGSVRFGGTMLDSGDTANQNAFVAVYDTGGSTGDDSQAPPARALMCYPNPFRDALTVRSSQATADVLHVYDLRGRMITSLNALPGTRESGTAWRWDGTDGSGRPCPNGVYIIRSGDAQLMAKVLLIRSIR